MKAKEKQKEQKKGQKDWFTWNLLDFFSLLIFFSLKFLAQRGATLVLKHSQFNRRNQRGSEKGARAKYNAVSTNQFQMEKKTSSSRKKKLLANRFSSILISILCFFFFLPVFQKWEKKHTDKKTFCCYNCCPHAAPDCFTRFFSLSFFLIP